MITKPDNDKLHLIALVINEPGFREIESMIRNERAQLNDLERMCGRPFEDGVVKGEVRGMAMVLQKIGELRKMVELQEKED